MGKISCALIILSIIITVCAVDHKIKITKYDNNLIANEKSETCDYHRSVKGAVQVTSYPTGYICELKSSLVFCCHPDKLSRHYAVNITLHEAKKEEAIELNEFAVDAIFEISCVVHEDNASNDSAQGQWKLFENGRLLDLADKSALQQGDYCLISLDISNDYHELMSKRLTPETQVKTTQNQNLDLPSAIRFVSVFCMAITIFVYLYLPQFISSYCKCCVCYFICLTLGFLLLCAENLYRDGWSSKMTCYIIGFCKHYTVTAVFLWLLAINYILWKTFNNFGTSNKTSILRCHLFVWSTAAVLPGITALYGNTFVVMKCIHNYGGLQPMHYCWYIKNSWYAMIAYYGPICLVSVINLTLSILTARRIYVEDKKIDSEWNSSESQRNLSNKADFIMFLRLFAIAGVIWLLDMLEMLSILFDIQFESITFISDIILSAQGILLLIATICKRNVLDSLVQRLKPKGDKPIKSRVMEQTTSMSHTSATNI